MSIRYYSDQFIDARAEYNALLNLLSSEADIPFASLTALLHLEEVMKECSDEGPAAIARVKINKSDFNNMYGYRSFDICGLILITRDEPFSPMLIGAARFRTDEDYNANIVGFANRLNPKAENVQFEAADRP